MLSSSGGTEHVDVAPAPPFACGGRGARSSGGSAIKRVLPPKVPPYPLQADVSVARMGTHWSARYLGETGPQERHSRVRGRGY
eukprot:COSAG02_NODE_34016_length_490_cov_120.370844_1_plen_82_part_10